MPYHIAVDGDCLDLLNNQSQVSGALISKLQNHLPHIGLETHQHWTGDDIYYDDFGCGWKVLDKVPHLFDSPLKGTN